MSHAHEISAWVAKGDVLVKDFASVVCEPSDLPIYGRVVDTDIFHDDELRNGDSEIIDTVMPDIISGLKAVPDDHQMEFYARVKNPNSTLVYLPRSLFEGSTRLIAVDRMLNMAFQNDPHAVRDLAQVKVVQQPAIMSPLRSHCDDDGQELQNVPVKTRMKGSFDCSRFYLMTNLGGTHVSSKTAPNGRAHRCGPGDIAAFAGDTYHSVYTTGLPEEGRICFRLGFRSDDIVWTKSLDSQDLFDGSEEGLTTVIGPDDERKPWQPSLIPDIAA